jgi:hypothetical protein
VNGGKRHLLVDTQGLVIKAKVHPADVHDKEGAKLLLGPLAGKLPRMAKVWMDQGCPWMGPGGGEALVDGAPLGVGSWRSGTSGTGYSSGIPGVATKVGGGTDLWVAGAEPAAVQRL